jgi:hypothetical protein
MKQIKSTSVDLKIIEAVKEEKYLSLTGEQWEVVFKIYWVACVLVALMLEQ